jgi:hypothetical protein
MYLVQPVADQLEGFTQALLQRRVQLLVDGVAHGFELLGIFLAHRFELGFQRLVHFGELLLVALA